MENAVVQQIRKRITRSKFGEIFFVSSFPQYDVEYVTKLLAIFEKEGYEIVEHRRKFYHVGYVDYDKELPANIQIVPSGELMSSYEADYNEMKESFIYGQALDFGDLMERIKNLQGQFGAIEVPEV